MSRRTRNVLLTAAGIVVAILLLGGGFTFGMSPDFGGRVKDALSLSCANSSTSGQADFQLQQEILGKLESDYYEAVDPSALETQAIDGMVAGLNDPYTIYMDPQEYASFIQDTKGSYSGVGMTVEMKNRQVTIISLFKGSPADQAGIRPGDIIVSVDGATTDSLNLDEVVAKIKGAEGTTVDLEIYRPPVPTTTTSAGGSSNSSSTSTSTTTTTEPTDTTADNSQLPPGGSTQKYTLTRKTIAIPVTDTELLTAAGKTVALIHFYAFSTGSGDALRAEVQKAVTTDHAAAIILDLRSNGGGLLDQAIAVASIFIPSGRIVSTQGLHSPEQVYNATGNAFAQIPLYVLTDPYTASASEIVSGALQDYKRATLVGETTFGKGLVQSIEPLSNGGALKITTAVYLTPNGRDINKKGITPDVVAPDDPSTPNVDETVQKTLELIANALSGK